MKMYAVRFKSEVDLKTTLSEFCVIHAIKAACILSCVGSLQKATLRLANQSEARILNGKFEIISLTGTMSVNGLHLHIAIADENGVITGGHLMPGCIIFTTAEIILGLIDDVEFLRVTDDATGYKELIVKPL